MTTNNLDNQGHGYHQPIVSSSRPPRRRYNDNARESNKNTTNFAPNDDVVNENDFYDALLVGPAPSVKTNVDNNNEEGMTFIQQYLGQIITTLLSMIIVLIVFVILPMYAVQAAKSSRWDHTLYYICGVFVLIAVPISIHGIVQHLVNYYMPQVQKYVIRILFMVPIFSIQSWFSLFFNNAAFYIRAFREVYEAFVLSSFLYYIFELLGGEDQLIDRLQCKDANYGKHGYISRLFIKSDWIMGRQFVMNCKYGVLQLVLVKLVGTTIMIILQSMGKYHPKLGLGWKSPSLYIGIIMIMSITYAMYCLVKLYLATKDDLKEWNPLSKFMCIKGIIFFTFWQGFLISVLHYFGVLDSIGGWDHEHVSNGLQDFLLAFEMVGFAIAHRYAFPHTDYIHYLKRTSRSHTSKRRQQRQQQQFSGGGGGSGGLEAMLLFDSDNNVVVDFDNDEDPNNSIVDVEYAPPTVRQLDRPMSVHRALLGVVPNETLSDIARMGYSGLIGGGGGGNDQNVSRSGGSGGSQGLGGGRGGGDMVISRDHAELI